MSCLLLITLAAVQAAAKSQEAPGSDPSELALRATLALAQRRCAYLRCSNMAGESEAKLRPRRCSGCATVRYCSEACSRAHWQAHKAACRRLQAQRAAVG